MDEELKKLFDLFEEGKISKDEFIDLVKAIKEGDKKSERKSQSKKFKFVFDNDAINDMKEGFKEMFDGMGNVIQDIIPKREKTENEYEIKGIEKIEIAILGGNLHYEKSDEKKVIIERNAYSEKVNIDGKTMKISIMKGDASIKIPESIDDISIKILGGNVEGFGDIKDFSINVKGGNADIKCEDIKNLEANILGGNLLLSLPKDIDATMNLELRGGNFKSDIGTVKPCQNGSMVGTFGSGKKGKMDISIVGGSFKINALH